MKTLSLLSFLGGLLVLCAASQSTPGYQSVAPSQDAPASAPSATQKPAPSFSPPVVLPEKAESVKPPDENLQEIATLRKRVVEVNVTFTVTDKYGHLIKNLRKDDIRVLDDHKPPSSVVQFSTVTDVPLRVGLLIDASNSIRSRLRFEQEAATYFLSQIVRPNFDEAFVLGFDTSAAITQDFTDNTEKLSHGVRMLHPSGGTAIYDAVYYACHDKLLKANFTGPVRRAIILVSDGEDNQSRVRMSDAIEMAQRAEVILYAISTNVSNVRTRGDTVMEKMAEATGGRVFLPFKIEDLSSAFSEIQDVLRSEYAVAYKPADFKTDGRYRTIEILADNKKYNVHARKGYYAPTQ